MTRKRFTHELVKTRAKRNTLLKKRSEGLVKKAKELSILCGVEIGMVAHNQRGENMLLWPSPERFRETHQRFQECPPLEREKKMVTHEKFLEQLLKSEAEKVQRMKKGVEQKEELQQLAMTATEGKPLESMDLHELRTISGFVQQMLRDLYRRKEELEAARTSADMEAGQPLGNCIAGSDNRWYLVAEVGRE